FQALIREMISHGWALRTINVRIGFIKQFFKYALDCDLVTAEQFFKIKSVPRIRRDDIRVKPERVVPPVEVDVVQRTLPYFSPMVADMVTVQLHSGMRAGELCRLNWAEIDRSGTVWMYRPEKHKTANKGKKRAIPLGPVCRAVLEQYESSAAAGGFVFNPQDIERRASAVRKPRTTNRTDHYNSDRYTREIRGGVDAAIRAGAITTGERWASHQLRHRAGTDARAKFGIDAAQLLLGHSDVRTSERYALPDESKVLEFAEMLG
ncbi:MAG: site-specific integrase, partial [Thermoguttaceae bacterium]|nr:site-specific integrase [Thermoguttaceae bacterium]